MRLISLSVRLFANILAGPLVSLAPQLSGLVKSGGRLALSGILAEQGEDVQRFALPGQRDDVFGFKDQRLAIEADRLTAIGGDHRSRDTDQDGDPEALDLDAEAVTVNVMLLIIEAAKDGGRVAGPSWFVRDWWIEKLNPAQLKDQRLAAVQAAVERRRLEDAEFFAAERRTCIQDAIDGGALPS